MTPMKLFKETFFYKWNQQSSIETSYLQASKAVFFQALVPGHTEDTDSLDVSG